MFVFNIIVVEKFMISQFPTYDINYYKHSAVSTGTQVKQEQQPLTKKQKGVILASSVFVIPFSFLILAIISPTLINFIYAVFEKIRI